jgi:surfeit locus 1 family protein
MAGATETAMKNNRTFPLGPTLFTLACVFILCGLGVWQIQRLHWKADLLARLDRAYANPDPPFMRMEDIEKLSAAPNPFARVKLTGHYAATEFPVGPRMHDGTVGYHIFTPLLLDTGGAVLANRGWVQADKKTQTGRAEGAVSVTGLLRPLPRRGFFTPPDNPAKNEWYSVDIDAMARAAQIDRLAPMVLYAETESAGAPPLPLKDELRWNPPNDHLQYAIFWFGMAGILLAIYYLRFIHGSGRG